jgi:predicted DNA-binding transcriptional regulator YafY
MPRGDSLFRQWELLKTLQAHRFGLTARALAERLEVSKRTVLRDLKVLQTHFPIASEQRDFGRKFWRMPSDFVASEQLPLTVTEMLSLYLSQQLLDPLRGTPFGDGLASALRKIKTVLPGEALAYFADMDGGFLIKPFGRHDYSGQHRAIETLNDAVLNQRVVRLRYRSASQGRQLTCDFHPYGLVLLGASLYCIGWLSRYDEVRTLKVSRMRSVEPTDRTFQKPSTFSLRKHTRGAFGVFGPGRFRTVRCAFTGWAATNVRENEWHRSQRIVEDDGPALTAEWELSSTVEFKRWLLGFGRHAKVLTPRELAREVAEEHAAAAESYGQPAT